MMPTSEDVPKVDVDSRPKGGWSVSRGRGPDRAVGHDGLRAVAGRTGVGVLDLAQGQAVTALTVYAHLYAALCDEQLDSATDTVAGAS